MAIVRALFGTDGGNELGAATQWLELADAYGEQDDASVYEDFRNRFNLDGPSGQGSMSTGWRSAARGPSPATRS